MLTLITSVRVLLLPSQVPAPTDNMAGDQFATWNQIDARSNESISCTHLTIFVSFALGAFILANLKSPKGDSPNSAQSPLSNPTHLLSSPHLDHFTLASLLSFPITKISSWTLLDRLQLQALFDLNLFPSLLSRMKASTMESLVGRCAFRCHRQLPSALLADSLPR